MFLTAECNTFAGVPAGALAVAGMKQWIESSGTKGERLIAINSGANLNFDRLRHISERAGVGEHREALIAVEIPERRGAFLAFCTALGRRNVTEFNYRYAKGETAKIFVGVSLSGARGEAGEIARQLEAAGYRVRGGPTWRQPPEMRDAQTTRLATRPSASVASSA